MTRRIALTILITACAMLIIGGLSAYAAVRQMMLAELDELIIERAAAARGVEDVTGATSPRVIARRFVQGAAGARLRTLTLQWNSAETDKPLTSTHSAPAARFDRTMRHLAVTLMIVLGLGATVTGAVAGRASGIAMRPLHETAETIGDIDERHLDRRIDASALPSELVPVATRLNEMLERLERAFTQRHQFMINAAHELRSPVAALRTTLEVALQRPKDAAALTQVLEKCLASTRMLNRLADLLTEQLRDEVPARPEPEALDVAFLLRQCADVAEALARAKQIALVRSFPAELSLLSDPDLLSSIVMNLLSNAMEYTPTGGTVELICSFDGRRMLLVVRDTGAGIAAEHLPHVFQPFYRADGARRRDREHLGLGLYLVKSHVQTLGGSCELTSRPGAGTTVTISLPAQPAPDDPEAAAPDHRTMLASV